MAKAVVAIGRKFPAHKTITVVYALKEMRWHPDHDVRSDPDLMIDVDEIRKQRLEERDI